MANLKFIFKSVSASVSMKVGVQCIWWPLVSLGLVCAAPLVCVTESQPNPIAAQYPKDVTGTINGTTAIIPIPYNAARSLVPSQYGLLTRAAQSRIPNLPAGTFPVVLEAVLDHDVQMSGIKIPDFQRIALKVPFVDRLNDGYSSFKYTPPQLLSLNIVALLGSAFYGTTLPGNFEPSCNPYASRGDSTTGSTSYVVPGSSGLGSKPAFNTNFRTASSSPYSIEIFKNVTNQPIFGSGVPVCDNYITLFNTSITTGVYAPVPVIGNVTVSSPFYTQDMTFTNVWGYRMDNAFIERNNKPCESLKGYSGTGSGD